MRRTRALQAVSAAAVTLVVASGCGGGGGTGEAGGTTERGAATSTSASPSSTPSGAPSTPGTLRPTTGTTKTKPPSSTTLTGTAVRGVEPGCVGIKAEGKTYQLSGDEARALAKSGGEGQNLGKIRVKGHFAPKGMASTCMMGDIFVVAKLEKI